MGLSPDHASTVPLVLNLDIGAINPQFHAVFDDWFTTVTTSVDDLLDFNSSAWSKTFGDSEHLFIRDDVDDTQVDFEDSMASEAITPRQNPVSKAMDTTMPPTPFPVSPPPSSPSIPSRPPSPVSSFPMSPSSPPIAVSSPSIGASPPALPQREKPHLAQPNNRGSPQELKAPHHPSHLNR